MDWIGVTKFLLVLAIVTIFVWDTIVMFFCKDLSPTFSFTVYDLSRQYPILPFALGLLCGHVFWPLKP